VRIDFTKTASGPESSFSLTRQAQTNRYDRRIITTGALSGVRSAIFIDSERLARTPWPCWPACMGASRSRGIGERRAGGCRPAWPLATLCCAAILPAACATAVEPDHTRWSAAAT
jgi:hypothetical protein